ncbi:SGNH/GDSL hydrolase family protein [Polaromonas sp. CG_23.6]|uniref:SGNH/GDSL hydrolase family protein n=1 Tax=Polaromonas sp. CG_23.6 TaxID=2760709 RepID=UPI00247497E9|nr:SGNH/GDSL hydrolase family protein [Polaromonas sp. CG_23.6]MDH6185473.1 lysophospholipase L1-like esterase [Polaromonas sp. CG_23.6]
MALSVEVFSSAAAGLAGTPAGKYFSVPSAESNQFLILYLNTAGVAVEKDRYSNAAAVQKPAWSGKVNGWPDPFFRKLSLTSQKFLGRDRWYQSNTGAGMDFAGWTHVNNSIFDGKALRRVDGYNNTSYSGPYLWLDEIGALPGDTVTAYVLITGASGGTTYSAYQFTTDSESVNAGAGGSMLNSTGGNNITPGATPQWLRISIVVPATATRLRLYPYNLSGSTGFDLLACWAFKGDSNAGPSWPTLTDNYFALRDTEFGSRVAALESSSVMADASTNEIRSALVPYVVYQNPLGDSELVGDGTYTSKVPGLYEVMTRKSLFNAIQARVWAANSATNIEWKVWLRPNLTTFNTLSTAPNASGTISAGSFPVTDSLYTLQLPAPLLAEAGQYVLVMFRAVDDTSVSHKKWTYNAAISPARHGFTLSINAGWNNTFSISSTGGAYDAVSIKLLLQSEELRKFVAPTSAAYNPSTSLLAAITIQAAIDELAGSLDLIVPPVVYGVQNRECNVYFDNLHTAADSLGFWWNADSTAASTGTQQAERWTWTPPGAVASGNLTIEARDKRSGRLLATKTMAQRAAAASAGTGMVKNVMVIGDSLVNAGVITQTLMDIAAADAMGVTLLGTQGTAPNKHEGRGGWTVANYTAAGPTYYDFTVSGVTTSPLLNATEYTNNGSTYRVQTVNLSGGSGTLRCSVVSGGAPLASGTLTKSNAVTGDATIAFSAGVAVAGNPFWIGGAVNFPQYLTNYAVAVPDWVFIGLGINDVFGQTTDAAAASTANAAFTNLDVLISSIKAAGAGVKVGLMLPTPPSSSQDAFGANYGTTVTTARFKRNILIWARELASRYATQEAARIYIVPSNTALDTVNGMHFGTTSPVNSRSAITVARQSNGVHPAVSGYQQIGDALWAFLKFYA